LEDPNQPLIRRDPHNSVHDIFENGINWLPLMLLEKVVEDKEKIRGSNSQVKHCINGLKAFICAPMDRNSSHD
jgi:hypothetical protein